MRASSPPRAIPRCESPHTVFFSWYTAHPAGSPTVFRRGRKGRLYVGPSVVLLLVSFRVGVCVKHFFPCVVAQKRFTERRTRGRCVCLFVCRDFRDAHEMVHTRERSPNRGRVHLLAKPIPASTLSAFRFMGDCGFLGTRRAQLLRASFSLTKMCRGATQP